MRYHVFLDENVRSLGCVKGDDIEMDAHFFTVAGNLVLIDDFGEEFPPETMEALTFPRTLVTFIETHPAEEEE